MGVLRELGRLAGNLIELVVLSIGALICAAIWAIGAVIDLFTDILEWINNIIEKLIGAGKTPEKVTVIDSGALSAFIEENQQLGRYTIVTREQLNNMRNSVINVVTDKHGAILEDQMIRSNSGFAENTKMQFNGQPMIKIPV